MAQFVQDTAQAACRMFGVSLPGGVKVKYSIGEGASAFFTPSEQSVTVNLRQCRTKRDIVFAIGHEVGHAVQYRKLKSDMLFEHQMEVFLYGYNAAPMEVEADTVGFAFEAKAKYKNAVIHRDVPSVFIHRKKLRAQAF